MEDKRPFGDHLVTIRPWQSETPVPLTRFYHVLKGLHRTGAQRKGVSEASPRQLDAAGFSLNGGANEEAPPLSPQTPPPSDPDFVMGINEICSKQNGCFGPIFGFKLLGLGAPTVFSSKQPLMCWPAQTCIGAEGGGGLDPGGGSERGGGG